MPVSIVWYMILITLGLISNSEKGNFLTFCGISVCIKSIVCLVCHTTWSYGPIQLEHLQLGRRVPSEQAIYKAISYYFRQNT